MGRRQPVSDGAGARDRRHGRAGRQRGEEVQGRRHRGSRLLRRFLPQVRAMRCRRGAVLPRRDDADLQRPRTRQPDPDPGRLLDPRHRRRGLRAARPRRHPAGTRRAAAVRGHHHLFAAAPLRPQEGRQAGRGRAGRPRPHGGEVRRGDGRGSHRAEHLGVQAPGRARPGRAQVRDHARRRHVQSSWPAASTSSSTRCPRRTTTMPISPCSRSTAP